MDRPAARYLCLAGPTAAGKSAAALAIAERLAPTLAVEIVSVDSAQVYRGMDIGTAKPDAGDRTAVPHHLIDLIEPSESYSAARFVVDASAAIEAIAARGALALLVGGTMLYFKALFDGLDTMPGADLGVRAEIEARARRDGWPALHGELARVDPQAAARLAPNDAQRIQRALEVHRLSGRSLSSWQTARGPGLQPPLISLEPHDRAWLHRRIDARFKAMLDAGLLDEVRALRARGDLDERTPSMRAVGYRQAWAALDADGAAGADALASLQARGSAASRQLAKRQLTWLRAMPWRQAVACDATDATRRVVEIAVAAAAGLRPRAG